MKRIFLCVSFLLFSFSIYAQQEKNAQEDLFDFWVGTWDAVWDEADGKKGKGINFIEKILDGKVLQEHFKILEGQNKGFKGTSISVFNPQSKEWKQSWADNQGAYFAFKGRAEGEQRIFQTEVIDLADGKKFTQRMVFKDITKDAMTWDWEASNDGGKNWTLNWRIHYTRSKKSSNLK